MEIEGRLIPFASHQGSRNMAIDQAILECCPQTPTLRFYGWSTATLSLGYFQRLADREPHLASRSLPLVRRSTGGGAIVHDRELTYSLVLPLASQKHLLFRPSALGAVPQLYEIMHLAVIDALRDLGCRAELYGDGQEREAGVSKTACSQAESGSEENFLCFQRLSEWDVTMSGYKVLGSAQRRVRGTVLQHGSVLIVTSAHAPELPGLSDLGLARVTAESLAAAVLRALRTRLQVKWIPGSLDESEQNLSDRAIFDRFANEGWTDRR